MNRGIKKILLLSTILSLVFSSACSSSESTPASATVPTTQQETVEAFGTVDFNQNDITKISVDFPMAIEKINIKEGQKVKKDDVLITFNANDLKDQINGKENELSIAKLEISKEIDSLSTYSSEFKLLNNTLKAKKNALSSNSDSNIKKLINDLSFAKASYGIANKELQIQQKLYNSGAISQHDYDEYKKTVDQKSKEIQDAESALKIMRESKENEIKELEISIAEKISSIGNSNLSNVSKGPSIQILQKKANSLQAELDSLKSKLSKPYIKDNQIISPYDNSIVYNITVTQGDLLNSGSTILNIATLDSIIIKANVSEEFIKDVKLGAQASIVPDSDKTKKFSGRVARIYSIAHVENGETVVPIEISLDDKDTSLIPNLNVEVTIKIN